jgi:hypothetical protein
VLRQACERHGDQVAFQGVNTTDTWSTAVSLLADLGATYAHVIDSDPKLLTDPAADGRIVPSAWASSPIRTSPLLSRSPVRPMAKPVLIKAAPRRAHTGRDARR